MVNISVFSRGSTSYPQKRWVLGVGLVRTRCQSKTVETRVTAQPGGLSTHFRPHFPSGLAKSKSELFVCHSPRGFQLHPFVTTIISCNLVLAEFRFALYTVWVWTMFPCALGTGSEQSKLPTQFWRPLQRLNLACNLAPTYTYPPPPKKRRRTTTTTTTKYPPTAQKIPRCPHRDPAHRLRESQPAATKRSSHRPPSPRSRSPSSRRTSRPSKI